MSEYSDGQLIGFAFCVLVTGFAVLWQTVNVVFDRHDALNRQR